MTASPACGWRGRRRQVGWCGRPPARRAGAPSGASLLGGPRRLGRLGVAAAAAAAAGGAERCLQGTLLGGCRAVGCRLRSASEGLPPMRAWAAGDRAGWEEAEPPSAGGGCRLVARGASGGSRWRRWSRRWRRRRWLRPRLPPPRRRRRHRSRSPLSLRVRSLRDPLRARPRSSPPPQAWRLRSTLPWPPSAARPSTRWRARRRRRRGASWTRWLSRPRRRRRRRRGRRRHRNRWATGTGTPLGDAGAC